MFVIIITILRMKIKRPGFSIKYGLELTSALIHFC